MYPKIKTVKAKDNYTLEVTFSNNEIRLYDIKPLLNQDPFSQLKQNDLFFNVEVDIGGYGISWNDFVDLSEYELYTKSTLI
jgi:Protein of unknown function (DUF2442)